MRPLLARLRPHAWVLIPVLIIAVAAVAALQIVNRPAAERARIVSCTGANAEQFVCWQDRYNAMVAAESPEASFADFKSASETNPYVKTNCHQIGHVIGRAAAVRYGNLTETYKHGDDFCWSGYYRGATEAVAKKIGKDGIVSQLTVVCADFLKSKPYGFDHYNCVHGMGHGLMAIEDGELFTSLKLCDKYDDSWQQQSCYSGVYMENVMNEINPGKTSKYLKQEEPLYPCTAVEDRYKEQCYLMQTSHALTVVGNDYDKVFTLCAEVAAPYNVTCYQSLGRDVSGQSGSDQARTLDLCMKGPTYEARDNCFTGAVKDFISYHHSDTQGLQLCAAIPDSSLATHCKSTATEYYKSF